MFESCQQGGGENGGVARCADVAEKLAQLFGWRQTYKVEKLQRSLSNPGTFKKPSLHLTDLDDNHIRNEKGGDSWVLVHSLQSQSDGGLLDPDDRLNDVADDREQIIANFEDGDGQHHHGGGDGASGSSVGTGSPDIFQGESHKFQPYSRTDIEVTGEQIASGLLVAPLQVRRGSESALNQLLPNSSNAPAGSRVSSAAPGVSNGQHWATTPVIVTEQAEQKEKRLYNRKENRSGRVTNGHPASEWYHNNNNNNNNKNNKDGEEDKSLSPGRFARDGSNRLSMQFLGEGGGYRWSDAAERAAVVAVNSNNRLQSKSLPRDHRRKEPLGQANSASPGTQSHDHLVQDSDIEDELNSDNVAYVVIRNETGPLGIHVVPDYDRLGKDRGLLVQGIEPGGRIDRDGRLAVYDRIIEINGSNLLNMPFHRVQEIFKDSLRSAELQLRVIKHQSAAGDHFKKPPAPVFPRQLRDDKENQAMVEGEERLSHKLATVSPTRKASPGHPASRTTNSLLSANTRKIGRKIELELVKGAHGLGFSITTRDNPAGGNCPIYIKNILTKGAAVEDGRLKPGDRLLEVNTVEMTGKTQSEAVAVLRNAPPGSLVRIVVSRQEDSSSPKMPRQIPADKVNEDGLVFPWKHREILTFDIPVHDTEKAGLGVSVKGKTSASHSLNHSSGSLTSTSSIDLGIFVKSVLHGGAASRDGRLRTNDQLLNVNGISLLAQSNSDAMETLRRAMLGTDGPVPGVISITVARRANGPTGKENNSAHSNDSSLSASGKGKDSDTVTTDNSGASETSDTTVIFLPYKSHDESRESQDSRDSRDSRVSCDSMRGIVEKRKAGYEMVGPRNPVIDRLTGQLPSQNALRNESYYRATNDTWNATMALSGGAPHKLASPTVNMNGPDMVLIEEEYHQPTQPRKEAGGKGVEGAVDATYTSQLSLEEAAGFSRDAFGRQSMSEKRHATLDAKHTDTYQRNKKLREERERYRHNMQQQQQLQARLGREPGTMFRANSIESIISMARSQADSENAHPRMRHEFGPSLGMKKSSSLESLQTMVQEIQMQEDCDPAYTYRNAQGAVRVIRGRGCNESFRAAVDRSYEAPLDDGRARMEMETLAEEEAGDGGTMPPGAPVPAFASVRGGPRQSSMNAALDKNKMGKKKPGLFRGIGSMFRFGKHRKTLDAQLGLNVAAEGAEEGEGSGWERLNEEREAARRAAQDEQQRIQEQYRRLMLRQKQMQQNEMTNGTDSFPPSAHHREGSVSSNHAGPRHNGMGPPGPHHNGMGPPGPQHNGMGPPGPQHNGMGPPGPQHNGMGPPGPQHNGMGPTQYKGHHRDGSNASSAAHVGSTHGQTTHDSSSSIHPHPNHLPTPPLSNQIAYPPPSSLGSHGNREGSISGGYGPMARQNSGSTQGSGGNYRETTGMTREREGSGSSATSQLGQGVYRETSQSVYVRDPTMMGPPPPPHGSQTRTERIHQLRAQHQRRHAERRGQYPMEEREEKYEQVIRQRLEQPEVPQGRPTPYDLYGEMSRPGSRVGITDPQRYSHYVNYEEIQVHLNRRQQHYHSQRRDNREPNQRPVSNFYEYESVQAFMRANQQQRTGGNMDANSNSLPRRIQQERNVAANAPSNANHNQTNGVQERTVAASDGKTINSNTNGALPLVHNYPSFHGQTQTRNISANVEKVNNVIKRPQGPFVTQVMIGQAQPPGSKV